jgi:hypothetical protein
MSKETDTSASAIVPAVLSTSRGEGHLCRQARLTPGL